MRCAVHTAPGLVPPPPLREQRPVRTTGGLASTTFACSCLYADPCTHSVRDLKRLLCFHTCWNGGIWRFRVLVFDEDEGFSVF